MRDQNLLIGTFLVPMSKLSDIAIVVIVFVVVVVVCESVNDMIHAGTPMCITCFTFHHRIGRQHLRNLQ